MKGDTEMRPTIVRPSFRTMFATIMGFSMCFMTISLPSFADTQWNVGISGGNEGINGFSLSIGEYYGVPEREVAIIHERGIYEEELPIVFYIAQRAHVYPEDVVDLRLSGMSWMDITLYFGLSPEIYYVPVVIAQYGPPYGHAYGYYQNHPRGGWKRSDLCDRDIVNQVNLKFISEHHRYAPEKIIRYRSEGRSFTAIDRDISNEKHGKSQYQKRNDTKPNDNRQNQYITKQKKPMQNVAKPNEYRQNMTKQNQQMQTVTKPIEYRQNQYVTRQNQQQMQNVPKPNEYRQNNYRQSQNKQNMPKQTLTKPNDNRQNQYITKQNQPMQNVAKPNEHKQNNYRQNQFSQNTTRQNQSMHND
jgi:hypothetical protein